MGNYIGMRIIDGAMQYKKMVKLYPQFKEDIDNYLRAEGRPDLIDDKEA